MALAPTDCRQGYVVVSAAVSGIPPPCGYRQICYNRHSCTADDYLAARCRLQRLSVHLHTSKHAIQVGHEGSEKDTVTSGLDDYIACLFAPSAPSKADAGTGW
jgi:hypothetical protein